MQITSQTSNPVTTDRDWRAMTGVAVRHILRALATDPTARAAPVAGLPPVARAIDGERAALSATFAAGGRVAPLLEDHARLVDGAIVGMAQFARSATCDDARSMIAPFALAALGEHARRVLAP